MDMFKTLVQRINENPSAGWNRGFVVKHMRDQIEESALNYIVDKYRGRLIIPFYNIGLIFKGYGNILCISLDEIARCDKYRKYAYGYIADIYAKYKYTYYHRVLDEQPTWRQAICRDYVTIHKLSDLIDYEVYYSNTHRIHFIAFESIDYDPEYDYYAPIIANTLVWKKYLYIAAKYNLDIIYVRLRSLNYLPDIHNVLNCTNYELYRQLGSYYNWDYLTDIVLKIE